MKYLSIITLMLTLTGLVNASDNYGSPCCGTPAHCKKPGFACVAMCFPAVTDGAGKCVTEGDACTTKEREEGTVIALGSRLECRAHNELDCRPACKKEGATCRTSSIARKTTGGNCMGTKDLRPGTCVRFKNKNVCLPIFNSNADEL